ncbi:methyltransferase CmcJ [Ophiobolus disseminans]|uniref:Methyltransferase CmcJ n=1 Tax=Ophiobolus disseminans TaxID=1469910 RepID=A0A6A7A992_9PLEO|nr:methyltransferase CmcJ [Ophiobolus disseminans]
MAKTVRASTHFIKWSDLYESEKPFQVFLDDDINQSGARSTNLTWEENDITVEDFRGDPQYNDIDKHGFTSRILSGFGNIQDMSIIEKEYIPAVSQLLYKELADAGTVFIFDWRIRDSRTNHPNGRVNFADQTVTLLPSNFAHIDMCPISIIKRIQENFPNDASKILQQRIRAINVWKPIDNPVEQWPLAVCDGTSMAPADLVETDSVRRDKTTTLYYARYSPMHKWFFLYRQTPEEALLFKHFDSKSDVGASFAMHSSVREHGVPVDALPRRSVEVRALVFSEVFDLPEE